MKRFLPIFFTVVLLVLATVYPSFSQTQNLNVSVSVPPRPTDLVNSLEATSGIDNVGSQTSVPYKITYGTTLSGTYDMTLVATWTTGTPSGGGATVDVVDYVSNSATAGYGGTTPVVNDSAKSITWSLHNVPGGSNKTINFTLKTKDLSTGTVKINFDTKSTLTLSSTFVTSTVSGSYKQSQPSTTTPTPSPTKVPSITPTVPVTPTPTLASTALFKGVSVRTVSSSSVGIGITTSTPAGITVSYGTAPGSLSQKRSDPSLSVSHTVTLSNLSANTVYYFKVNAIDTQGKTATSDMYTVKTALPSIIPEIDLSTIIVTSNNNILMSPRTNSPSTGTTASNSADTQAQNQSVVVIPQATKYEFTFSLQGKQSAKSVRAVLRPKLKKVKKSAAAANSLSFLFGSLKQEVLGAYTQDAQDDLDNVEIIEVQPGVYKGRLIGQPPPGIYELYIQVTDANGNIQEQKIAEIRIAKAFTIFSNANQPLEGAKVTLYSHSLSRKDFILVTPGSIASENPTYSLSNGTVNFVLPQGRYKAEVKAIGYINKTVPFSIGQGSDYPQVYLAYTGFNLFNQFEYYSSAALDFYQATVLYVSDLTHSIRFFELTALITVFLFSLLVLFSLSERMHVPVISLPFYFLHYAKIMITKRKLQETIRGRVYDKETKGTVSDAQVFLLDASKNQIVGSVATNTKGEFAFLSNKLNNYAIQVIKVGFEPVTYSKSELKAVGLGGYLVNIEKQEKNLSLFGHVKLVFEKLFSLLFEVLFILTFVFELALTTALPLIKVLPFLALSSLTLILWLIHMTHLHWSKNVK